MKRSALASAMLITIAAATANAQAGVTGPRWSAYTGCWRAVPAEGQPAAANETRVCVIPKGGMGAELISVVNGKVTERTEVNSDGAHHDVTRDGCSGWESAEWSADGKRLYFHSKQQCDGGVERNATGLFAMDAEGQWTNVLDVNAGGGQGMRVVQYTAAPVDSTYPAEITSVLGTRDLTLSAARIAARSRVTLENVIDASRMLDAPTVDAWLAALDQPFDVDAKALVKLADAGVAPQTIDVIVAVSNPRAFVLASNGGGVATTETPARTVNQLRDECYAAVMDPYGYFDPTCDSYYYRRRYGAYGYGYPYSNSYYSPWGYDPYYYGYGSGGSPVVVVVRGSNNDPTVQHGRMTRGGYTASGSSGSTASTTRTSTRDRSPSSSGSSGSSGSKPSSSSGSSSGRTAHPKPPGHQTPLPQLPMTQ